MFTTSILFTSCHSIAAAVTLAAPDFGSPSIDLGKMQDSSVLYYQVGPPFKKSQSQESEKDL